jgi:hypothetical protein
MKIFSAYTLFFLFAMVGCTSKIDFDPPPPPVIINTTDVLISEISTAINTDPNAGGFRSHYVELYNGTAASVNLSDYAIGYFAVTDLTTLNNFSFTAGNILALTGNLATKKCYVIASPQADPIIVKSDITWGTTSTLAANASSPLQLSGNSGIALLKKDAAGTIVLGTTNYRVIDCFGSPQVARVASTGSTSTRNNIMWTIAGETVDTRNRTFWRKATVLSPSIDWALTKGTTATDAQWTISSDRSWVYTNIGLPTP